MEAPHGILSSAATNWANHVQVSIVGSRGHNAQASAAGRVKLPRERAPPVCGPRKAAAHKPAPLVASSCRAHELRQCAGEHGRPRGPPVLRRTLAKFMRTAA